MKMHRVATLAAILSCTAGAPALAQDFDAGKAAADAGDFATALDNWRPLAEQGDVAAQYNLGMMYARGDGVDEDLATAAEWFERAAEQGHPEAQARIGAMYVRGLGVEQDSATGVDWLQRAAEQHHVQSQFDLGVLYANGDGVQNFYPAREAQMQMRRMLPGAQIGQVEQQVRDWLEENAGMRFERAPEQSPVPAE